MREYDEVVPGAAAIIVEMAKKQQQHRHTLERTHLEGSQQRESRGQVFAFWLSVGVLGIAAVLSYLGRSEGFWLIVALLIALASVFITGKKISIRELLTKRKDLVRGPADDG